MELDENGTAVSTDKRFKCVQSDLNLQTIRSNLLLDSSETKMRKRPIPTKTLMKRRNRLRRSHQRKKLPQREGLNSLNLR